jgi:sugar phosphate isomerase/epimerase
MGSTRRQFLADTAAVISAAAAVGPRAQAASNAAGTAGIRIGMCDWSMGRMTPSAFPLAAEIGLNGVQVSLGTRENNMWLRRPEIQEQYLAAARENKVGIASLAIGELNHVPLMSEPRAAVWVADAIGVAEALKVDNILLAFFSKGELKASSKEDMRRVIDVLAELAPRAEKAGVALGVESYLSAEDHLKILDAVKSRAVKVYYDLKNTADAGYDPLASLKLLGPERVCQIHFKDHPTLEKGTGKVDWPGAAALIKEMKYPGWVVLETPNPTGNVVADTRRNLEYVRRLFAGA